MGVFDNLELLVARFTDFGDWFLERYTDLLREQSTPLFRRLSTGLNLILAYGKRTYVIGEQYRSRRRFQYPGYLVYDETDPDSAKLAQADSITEVLSALEVVNAVFWKELPLPVEASLNREFAYNLAEQVVRDQADQIGIPYMQVPVRGLDDQLSSDLANEIDVLNMLFYDNYGARPIDIPSARFIHELSLSCNTEEQLVRNVVAVADFLNNMDFTMLLSSEEKTQLKTAAKSGSISVLESFLGREKPDYDRTLISNLRNINKLRGQYPVHSISKGVVDAHRTLGIDYPISMPQEAWSRIRTILLKALQGIHKELFCSYKD